MAGNLDRFVQLTKRGLTDRAILADALDVQSTSIGWKANLPQGGQVLQPFADPEVVETIEIEVIDHRGGLHDPGIGGAGFGIAPLLGAPCLFLWNHRAGVFS